MTTPRAALTREPVDGSLPAERDPRTDPSLVLAGVVPVIAAVAYSGVVGVRSIPLLVGLVLVAVALTGISWWLIRQREAGVGAPRGDVSFEVLALLVGPPVATVFAIGVLERPAVTFGLIIALPLVTGSYVLPRRWRLPLQFYAIVVWSGGLLLWAQTGVAVAAGHLAGGAALALLSGRTADRQRSRRAQERESRERAEALIGLLTSVQQVNSLQPQAVLEAAVRGLRELGLANVEVRRVDQAAGVARLVAGSAELDVALEEAVPLHLPLVREALAGTEPVIIEDATTDPRVTRHVGYHAGAILPLSLGGGGRGLLSVASVDGPITELQIDAMQLLADHAAQALERASVYEADLGIVEDLRRLDAQTQDFVSTASHELRTPLTVISGLGQTLQQRWDDLGTDRREDLLQRIDANADRLATMVRSLLDTSALDRGELRPRMERLALRDTVVRTLDRLATVTVAYPVEVEIDDDLEVVVDPGLFEHVLENLLTNVARHTPQGTSVIVSAQPIGERVRVAVTDHGPGITEEDLPHVLDRFYRGGDPDRRSSGGLGLGLALSQQIVRSHGGELEVRAQAGQGTTFSFSVPAAGGPR